ncbi:MAG: hypothetical protein CMK07_02705 [Ponticaulis sp.]|nr:hypothetical protein [Ponticaulis sp.]
MSFKSVVLSFFLIVVSFPALADERIHEFDVDITVSRNGNIDVTETISVTPEGRSIRRGIYRSLPRYYGLNESEKLSYSYDVKSVRRNGEKEPYTTYTEGNAWVIRMGDEDVFLPVGQRQTYEIRYTVKNQIRYQDGFDEFYWNVTGSYWEFPIDSASAIVTFPDGADFVDVQGYTGRLGTSGQAYRSQRSGNSISFETTQTLNSYEGLTISVSLRKGLIDPPSLSDEVGIFWQRFVGLLLLVGSLFGVLFYYYQSWTRVGRDAAKLPVFPIYNTPKDYSPAAAHVVYYRTFKGNEAFSASLIDLAAKGYLSIETDKKEVVVKREDAGSSEPLAAYQHRLFNDLLSSRSERRFGKKYDSSFASAYSSFKSDVVKEFGSPYFAWNTGYVVFAVILSVIAFIVGSILTLNWTGWHTLAILGLVVVNLIFMYLMPAQTRKGAKARSEIAGLRLYLETAEKAQLNSVDVHGDALPPMSKERYEELLPYAMALNVEEPWTKYFEKVLPNEAENYNPAWGHGHFVGRSLHSATSAMERSISSGVSTASVQPSSSSGSSGGGFSGGGGGGGGGGGW